MRNSTIVGKAHWRVPAVVGALLLALALFACASSAGASSTGGPPAVITGTAAPSGAGVELEGTINPKGEAVTYYFQYGPTTAYGSQTPTTNLEVSASTSKVNVNHVVSGLLSGYHYRLVATNAKGETTDGHDRVYVPKKTTTTTTKNKKSTSELALKFTFTTKPPAEGQLVGSSLTIAGTLSGLGVAGRQVVLQASSYPVTSTVFTNVTTPQTLSSTGRFSFFVAHLLRSTRYRVAVVGAAPTYSSVITALATVRVTLHVRTVRTVGLVRLYGTVSPAVTGAIVYFQLQQAVNSRPNKPVKTPKNQKAEEKAEEKAEQAETPKFATAFSAPVKRATKSLSRFSIIESVRKTGLYRAYVQVPKGSLASGHSGNVLLHASPKKKGKAKA